MNVELLEKLLLEQQNTIESMRKDSQTYLEEIRTLNQTISNLKEQIGLLTSKLFGPSSEKQGKQLEGQLSLFEEEAVNEVEYLAEEEVLKVASEVKPKSEKKAKPTKE